MRTLGRLSAHLQNSVSVLQMPSKHHKKIFGGFYLILMTLSTQVGFESDDVWDYLLDGADFGKISHQVRTSGRFLRWEILKCVGVGLFTMISRICISWSLAQFCKKNSYLLTRNCRVVFICLALENLFPARRKIFPSPSSKFSLVRPQNRIFRRFSNAAGNVKIFRKFIFPLRR